MMNDFTKEELEDLKTTILNVRVYTDLEDYDSELLSKIQYMINNYDSQTTDNFNPKCYCGQIDKYNVVITDCGYPPHKDINDE